MEKSFESLIISDQKEKLQFERIVNLLHSTHWAKQRDVSVIRQSIENCRCFGVYEQNGTQIAFARILTDNCTIYYISDVVVDASCRKQGVGRALIEAIVNDESLIHLKGLLLTTYAQDFYASCGFEKCQKTCMIHDPLQRIPS